MNGTIARLLGAVAVASTLILGGCVTEAGGEEQEMVGAPTETFRPPAQLDEATVTLQPTSSPKPSGSKTADFQQAGTDTTDTVTNDPGDGNDTSDTITTDPSAGDPNADPEPSPWQGPIVPHTPH